MFTNIIEFHEENLWKGFLEGDDNCLEKIYRIYFDKLYNYGNRWLRNAELSEDSIQDLFIKLLSNRKNLSQTTSVKYYLFRSFRSIVLDKLKKENHVGLIDNPCELLFVLEVSPENKLIDKQEYQHIKSKLLIAVNSLTPRQREAIFLRYTEGFSYEQVAILMGLTPKATYKLMARAVKALKENIPISCIIFHKILFHVFS